MYVSEMGTVQQTDLTLVSFLDKHTVQKLIFFIDDMIDDDLNRKTVYL